METVFAAAITAIPATIAACAAWRSAKRTERQIMPEGQDCLMDRIKRMDENVLALRQQLAHHIAFDHGRVDA